MNVERKKLKTKICRIFFCVCLKGPRLNPLNKLWLFFCKMFFFIFFSTFIKNAFDTNLTDFHKNMHVIKKKDIFYCKVFKLQRFSNVFPNITENVLFWRSLIKKNIFKQWIRHQVLFFLRSLSYKLVNLLVFQKKSFKMSKN